MRDLIDIIEENDLVLLNNGSPTTIGTNSWRPSGLDLTMVSSNLALSCEWQLNPKQVNWSEYEQNVNDLLKHFVVNNSDAIESYSRINIELGNEVCNLQFADDLVVYSSGDNIQDNNYSINGALKKLNTYLDNLTLDISINKTLRISSIQHADNNSGKMKTYEEDTPPSSINGDEVSGMDEDGIVYYEEMEEIQFDEEMDGEDDYTEMDPPEDHAHLVFDKHSGSVFCGKLHPEGKLAVTGGEDDVAFVWSTETGEVVMKCDGHKDSVIFAEFSFCGAYLATADMSGVIKVWQCNTDEKSQQPWPMVFEYEADDLSLGLWHFGARVLIVGTDGGDIYVFKIPTGETKVLQGHNIKIECAKVFSDGKRLAAGYEDGALKIWDLKTGQIIHHIPSNVHQMRITDLDTHPENNLIASISTDGKVVLTASVSGKVVSQLDTDNDLEVVNFSQDPQLDYFAIGTLNGSVSIWDCTRQMIRYHCSKSSDENATGVTKMLWIKDHLVTAGLDGSVTVYEGRSGKKLHVFTGHRSELLDISFNCKANILLTTSDDGTARIFKYEFKNENA
ncbi:hypothetical protein evm_001279 [Chilo suppressalis]|nr:hypothetical protein evm_001279 [Chilo suppressalis]